MCSFILIYVKVDPTQSRNVSCSRHLMMYSDGLRQAWQVLEIDSRSSRSRCG